MPVYLCALARAYALSGNSREAQKILVEVETMQDRLRLGLPIDTHSLAVAGWMRYVTARDESGKTIDVRDPLAAELAAIAVKAGPVADRLAPALLEMRSIFGELGADVRMCSAVTRALAKLYEVGARQAVQAWRPT